ncbi:MAG TPA: glycosyltransferase family 9 protein [Methylomirabilota bacterium]|nr:glycosyltransferase family 9 protein [Methylomirabilota bacterium]
MSRGVSGPPLAVRPSLQTRPSSPPGPGGAQRPVALFHNGFGDRLLTLPALRALASLFPHALGLICAPGDRHLFYSDLPLAAVYEVEFVKTPAGWRFDASALAEAVGGCDLFLSLAPWYSASVDELLRLLPGTETVGFFPAFRHRVSVDGVSHAADMAFGVPRWFDRSLRLEDFAHPPLLPADAMAFAREFRATLPRPLRLLAVHTETLPDKTWPADRFRRCLERFLECCPQYVALALDEQSRLSDASGGADWVLECPGLPLPFAMALVGSADLFLGVDSCLLHASDLFRVPGVGLFGPTSCRRFGFRLARHRHVSAKGPMARITEEDVLTALRSLAG